MFGFVLGVGDIVANNIGMFFVFVVLKFIISRLIRSKESGVGYFIFIFI